MIGGIALIRHGVVRAMRDIDAVFDSDTSNVERIRVLMERWGAARPDGSPIPRKGSPEIGRISGAFRGLNFLIIQGFLTIAA